MLLDKSSLESHSTPRFADRCADGGSAAGGESGGESGARAAGAVGDGRDSGPAPRPLPLLLAPLLPRPSRRHPLPLLGHLQGEGPLPTPASRCPGESYSRQHF